MEIRAIFLVALSGMLYGFLGYFGTQLIAENFSISTMLFWRFFIAGLWMLAWDWWKQEKFFKTLLKAQNILFPVLFSAGCYVATTAFYFLASHYTGTGIAMVIFFAYPVFVAIFVWAQNNWRISKYSAAALLAVIVGLFMLKGNNDAGAVSVVGIILAIISALFYAIFVFKSKHYARKMLSSHFTAAICLGCALISLILAGITNTFAFPTSLKSWIYIFGFSIFVTAIPIQLLQEGLKLISPLKASILSVLEPVVTLLVGIALLNESISFLQTMGIVVVLLSAMVIQFARE